MKFRLIACNCACCFLAIVLTLLAITNTAAHTTSYQIGNSLTWDSQPRGIAAIADDFGFDHTVGYHIRCGYSLQRILDDPTSTCVTPVEEFGTFGNALPDHKWNAVIMQPHPNADEPPGQEHLPASTLLSDVTSILTMIDLAQTNVANSETTFYIYSGWPKVDVFESEWTAAVADDDDAITVHAREYYDRLINRVRNATEATVNLIPVGEVLYELDQRMEAGQIPGFTDITQFYRDTTHLTFDLGRYTAGITTFATLFDTNPTGSTKPAGFYGSDSAFSPALYSAIQDAVWDVVSANAYGGSLFWPADFQSDGEVDAADLAIWESSFGSNALGDTDGDGDTDGVDFLSWQRAFDGAASPISSLAVTVPEPSSLVLFLACAVGGWMSSRRRTQRCYNRQHNRRLEEV